VSRVNKPIDNDKKCDRQTPYVTDFDKFDRALKKYDKEVKKRAKDKGFFINIEGHLRIENKNKNCVKLIPRDKKE
jgi:hypothetical protein